MKDKKSLLISFTLGIVFGFVIISFALAYSFPGLVKPLIENSIKNAVGEQGVPTVQSDKDANKKSIDWNSLEVKAKAIHKILDENFLNEVDNSKIEDSIFKGLVNSLEDPYSVYFNKEEYQKFNESTSGTYYGIGVVVSQNPTTGAIKVVRTFKKGSGFKAGILPEDLIIKVDDFPVQGEDLTKVVTRIKGKEGTFVKVTVRRNEKELDFDLERTKLEVETIAHEMFMKDGKKLGYIAVMEFDEVTLNQYREAIDELDAKGMEGLIVDLRDNPGGRLDIVVEMLDRMLPKGTLVYTIDKAGEKLVEESDDRESFNKPVSILINGNSASASEIFAGAMQDYKKATLVGETSFGKGIVQSIMGLGDGTAIKFTVSKYYTPNGRNIHGTGIEPDVKVKLDLSKIKEGKLTKENDDQLKKAMEVLVDKLDKK